MDDSWSLTAGVMVRDRAAESPGGAPIVRDLTISAFCSRCGVRRGAAEPVTHRPLIGSCYQASYWVNPCGHHDTDEDIIIEAELSCVVPDCVLLVSDINYPYCSPDCMTAATGSTPRGLRLEPRLDRPAL